MVGISPDQFWNMGLPELYAAIEGFYEFNGSHEEKPMDRNELKELMELYPD
jgi:uncharacterized phage protein (TIGR02216 family)